MFSTNANVNSAQKSAVQTEQSANTSRSEINLAKVSISDQPMLKKPRLVEESLDQCMPEKRYLSQQSKNTISLGLQDLPPEILQLIVAPESISFEDVLSLKNTCKTIRSDVELGNRVIPQKWFSRFPTELQQQFSNFVKSKSRTEIVR